MLPILRLLPAKLVCTIFIVFSFLFGISALEGQTYLSYYRELQAKARRLNLAADPYWLRLLHYKPKLWGGYKSEADGPLFFMAANGREDPQAELEATLYGFFIGDFLRPQAQHPRCRFPERFYWLASQLQIDESKLLPVNCDVYSNWRANVKIESVSFIFASYYINNPSSMFGHTFLKLNREGTAKNRELIDYGLNFAANPTTQNPILYGVMGIFGGFRGTYLLFPYYFKVREYNDLESRDLWEYPLNLTADEIERLMRHSWELGSTWFDYYYFDENCSYQILTLLEVVRPQLNLSDNFFYVVQPVDTVKSIVRIPKLTSAPHYRPSQYNKYLAYFEMLTLQEQQEFFRGEKNKSLPNKSLSAQSRAAIIDVHLEYHNFRYTGETVIPPEQKKFVDELLLERASLGYLPEARKPNYTIPDEPSVGHESTTWKLSFFSGSQGLGGALMLRPALRELIDAPIGYSPFSQVIMFDMGLRFYPEERALPYFDFLNFVDLISLAPLKRSYLRPSWALRFGLHSLREENILPQPNDRLTSYVEFGGGFTLPVWHRLSWFTLLQLRFEASPALPQWVRTAPVLTSGILWRILPRLSFLSRIDIRHYVLTLDKPIILWNSGLNWGINNHFSFEMGGNMAFIGPYNNNRDRYEIIVASKIYL